MEIGGYPLSGVIGSGGFGTVYLGTDPADGSPVAIKVLDRGIGGDFGVRAAAEADAMRRVDDPNCVRVRAVIDEPPAIVTDFVDGASLRAVLDRYGRLTGPQALDVLSGALRGLIAVHRAGLLHGDLKPDNVLVDKRGAARLIDFGLAAAPAPIAEGVRQLTGSPGYLSPEQIRREPADVRSDVYACAVMLFELLCGVRPYAGPGVEAVLAQHLDTPVPDPRAVDPTITQAFAHLCITGMAKDPADRPQTAAEFLAALEDAARERYGVAWRSGAGVGALVAAIATGSALGARGASAGGAASRRGVRFGSKVGGRAVLVSGAAAVIAAAVAVTIAVSGGNRSARSATLTGHLLIRTATSVEVVDPYGVLSPALPTATSPVCCTPVALSPDGQRVLVTGEGFLGVQRIGAKPITTLWASSDESVGAMAWSPDGSRVAFATLNSRPAVPTSDVEVVNADGSGPRRTVAHGLNIHSLAWSPDGNRLAFTQNQGGIYAVSASGGAVTDVLHAAPRVDDAALPGELSWSPADTILFNEVGFVPEGVWEVSGNGSRVHSLLPGASSPSWAPDARHFAAILGRRVVIADSSGLVGRTIEQGGAQSVQWSG